MSNRIPIFFRLQGGLGNQLFQICYGKWVARTTGRKVIFWFYSKRDPFGRRQMVDEFTNNVLKNHLIFVVYFLSGLTKFIGRFRADEQSPFSYRPLKLKSSSLFIEGYFQTFEYDIRHCEYFIEELRDFVTKRFESRFPNLKPRIKYNLVCIRRFEEVEEMSDVHVRNLYENINSISTDILGKAESILPKNVPLYLLSYLPDSTALRRFRECGFDVADVKSLAHWLPFDEWDWMAFCSDANTIVLSGSSFHFWIACVIANGTILYQDGLFFNNSLKPVGGSKVVSC